MLHITRVDVLDGLTLDIQLSNGHLILFDTRSLPESDHTYDSLRDLEGLPRPSTRGQFITLMMRAYNMAADKNTANNFSDAGNTYYTGYLAAAKRLGIAGGVGDNKFAPEQAITRQEMFTMLYNTLKSLDKLPAGDSGKTLADFTDSGSVETWATEAMTALAKSGIVTGSGGKLDPTIGSTRAQMA